MRGSRGGLGGCDGGLSCAARQRSWRRRAGILTRGIAGDAGIGEQEAGVGEEFAQTWQGLFERTARIRVRRAEPDARRAVAHIDAHFEGTQVLGRQMQRGAVLSVPGH